MVWALAAAATAAAAMPSRCVELEWGNRRGKSRSQLGRNPWSGAELGGGRLLRKRAGSLLVSPLRGILVQPASTNEKARGPGAMLLAFPGTGGSRGSCGAAKDLV